jgi:hypothetical protein
LPWPSSLSAVFSLLCFLSWLFLGS